VSALGLSRSQRCWWVAGLVGIGALLWVAVLPGSALAGGAVTKPPSSEDAVEAVRLGLLLGVVIEAAAILVLALARVPRWLARDKGVRKQARVAALFVGKDQRISTSKTIAVVWTLIVGATLFAMVFADLLDHGKPLSATNASGIVGQYAVLFGGPLGAAILAKTIVSGKAGEDPTYKPPAAKPKASDLIANDAGDTDLGDLQYVLFNAIALFFVLGTFLHHPLSGLPHIPEVLLGLTSVSAVGFVGKKMLPNETAVAASIEPDKGKHPDEVTVALTGLPKTEHPGMSFWVRIGSSNAGEPKKAQVAGHGATLQVTVPEPDQPPKEPVPVTIIGEDGTVVTADQKFTYE